MWRAVWSGLIRLLEIALAIAALIVFRPSDSREGRAAARRALRGDREE